MELQSDTTQNTVQSMTPSLTVALWLGSLLIIIIILLLLLVVVVVVVVVVLVPVPVAARSKA